MRDESRGNPIFPSLLHLPCALQTSKCRTGFIGDLDETAQAKLEASSSVWRSMKLLRWIQALVDGTLILGRRTEDGDVTRKESFERRTRSEADLGGSRNE